MLENQIIIYKLIEQSCIHNFQVNTVH